MLNSSTKFRAKRLYFIKADECQKTNPCIAIERNHSTQTQERSMYVFLSSNANWMEHKVNELQTKLNWAHKESGQSKGTPGNAIQRAITTGGNPDCCQKQTRKMFLTWVQPYCCWPKGDMLHFEPIADLYGCLWNQSFNAVRKTND